MPRGRKPQPNAKRANVIVRFQESELNAIREYVNRQDKHISTFIREVTLQHLESLNIPTTLSANDPNQLRIETD
jgi:hypothetical protein